MKKLLAYLVHAMLVFAESETTIDRIIAYIKSSWLFSTIAFFLGALNMWFADNQSFTGFAMVFVFVNSAIGGWVHLKKSEFVGRFSWEDLFLKTVKMICIMWLVYFVLEGIVSPIGEGAILDGIIASFQVATLLYPGSKILKNIFVWSDGEHPPKYIMDKIFNFKKDGNLQKLFSSDTDTENKNQAEYED